MNSNENNLSKTLKYLTSLETFGIKLGLEKMRFFLDAIGNPQLACKSVLVAGTNGKGSTSSMIAEIARRSEIKTGLYTSPHILTFPERFQIDSLKVGEERFIMLVEKLRREVERLRLSLTLFEFLTSLSFIYFYEERVDLAIFEVGLGGRLDATNVVSPALSIITEVDFDHMEHLGNSLKEITLEKCGIIREGGVALLTSQKREVVEVVTRVCKERDATLYRYGKEYFSEVSHSSTKHGAEFQSGSTDTFAIEPGMPGAHQHRNAATAIQAVTLLTGRPARKEIIKDALKNLRIEGRIESIDASKRFVFDIAHNPAAAACLAKTIREEFTYRNLYLVIGIMADKETESILKLLVPLAKTTILTAPRSNRAASPQLLKLYASRLSRNILCAESVAAALTEGINLAGHEDLILVTGSCHTVGEAKEFLNASQGR